MTKMNETEKQISRLLIGLAEYFQATMSKEQLQMYAREFDSPEYLAACIVAMKNDPEIRSGYMPLPAKIKAALNVSIEEQCYKTVKLIFAAAHRHGYYRPEDARRFVGPVAWDVVRAYGGWGQICQIETKSFGTAFAQLRDLAASIEKSNRIGGMREVVAITEDREQAKRLSQGSSTIGELVHQKLAEITKRNGSGV